MIVVTGAAGFIGSCLVKKLNDLGYKNLVLVDAFGRSDRARNLYNKGYIAKVEREAFFDWIKKFEDDVECIFHIGARTDTAEKSEEIFDTLNLNYSKRLWSIAVAKDIPFFYASSAATYGLGEKGYIDSHEIVKDLRPLNPYGASKNDFDKWVLAQTDCPSRWAGFKFFNVYGPNEYHKGRMASVIFHTFKQIQQSNQMRLFRSHREDVADGEQSRDFIYVKDLVDVLTFFWEEARPSGLYNLGTGTARTFFDLARLTFEALDKSPEIHFIDTPEDIRDTYQYYTQADMSKLKSIGYDQPFTSLEDGIQDYVSQYLKNNRCW